ncbi:MAG: hypothetical protein KJ915_03170, partial [Candidatus Omnitrophica bacterium]|nr:hypothetical protein [Candidatus Omnitrophota bacterium]
MQRYLRISLLCLLALNIAANVSAQTSDHVITMQFNDKQGIRDLYMKQVKESVDMFKAEKEISVNDNVRLLNSLQALQGKDIFRKNIDERRQVVQSTIGKEEYNIIQGYYEKFLEKGNPEQKKLAISILGPGLFDGSSIDKIKEYVFSDDPGLQYKAIWSLTYCGVDGMSTLLSNFILGRRLSPTSRLVALKTLSDTRSPEVEAVGLWIISKERNASFLRIALENIEKTKSYIEAVENIFLTNQFPISSGNELSKEEQDNNSLNYYLLGALYKNWENLQYKDKILAKVSSVVDNQYPDIYQYSAFIVNKYGNDEQKKLLKQVA